MRKYLIIILIIIVVAFVVSRGSFKSGKETSDKLSAVTSFYPLYFFTSEIVGDKMDVYNITPNGVEPHDYELSSKDRARIENSSLLVLNGISLEPWAKQVTDSLKISDTMVLVVGDRLESLTGESDPHVWLDPSLSIEISTAILEAVSEIDPANVQYYQSRHAALAEKLGALDSKLNANLSRCNKKDIVTTHAAFGYLAKRYGFNQVGIAGLSPDEEPSPKKMAAVADFARKNQVKYIFFEELVSPKLAETIANEIGAQTLVLNPLEGLNENVIREGGNYFTEMEKNLKNLKIALECQ